MSVKVKITIGANLVLDDCIHSQMQEEITVENLCEENIAEVCAAKSAEFEERIRWLVCASRLFNPDED